MADGGACSPNGDAAILVAAPTLSHDDWVICNVSYGSYDYPEQCNDGRVRDTLRSGAAHGVTADAWRGRGYSRTQVYRALPVSGGTSYTGQSNNNWDRWGDHAVAQRPVELYASHEGGTQHVHRAMRRSEAGWFLMPLCVVPSHTDGNKAEECRLLLEADATRASEP
eukprot:gene6774-8922_t